MAQRQKSKIKTNTTPQSNTLFLSKEGEEKRQEIINNRTKGKQPPGPKPRRKI